MCDDWDEDAEVVQPVSFPQKWNSNTNNDTSGNVWGSSGANMNYNPRPEWDHRSRTFTNRSGQGFSGRGSSRGRGSGGQKRNGQYNSNEVSETLNVPTRYVGRIIGMYLSCQVEEIAIFDIK